MKKNKLLTVIRVISKIIGIILMIVGGLTFIVGLIFRLIMGPVEPPQTDNVMMIGIGAILLLFQSIPFLMIFGEATSAELKPNSGLRWIRMLFLLL